MRAIESRMGIARAANTGISEFVDPLGYTHKRTPLDVQRVEADTVYTTAGGRSTSGWATGWAAGAGRERALLAAALVRGGRLPMEMRER